MAEEQHEPEAEEGSFGGTGRTNPSSASEGEPWLKTQQMDSRSFGNSLIGHFSGVVFWG
jgi:hypothetical protein